MSLVLMIVTAGIPTTCGLFSMSKNYFTAPAIQNFYD